MTQTKDNLQEPFVETELSKGQRLYSGITIDDSRDALLTEFALATLKDRYMLPGETPQEAFARPAVAFCGGDLELAQRIYNYVSQLWFFYSTPILSNGGTARGLPISCFLNYVEDSLQGINEHHNENTWLASRGGGIGGYWGNLRSDGMKTSKGSESTGSIPFLKVVDSQILAVQQGTCYVEGTEVLTDSGWKDFRDLTFLDKVAQVTAERTAEFVHPLDIIVQHVDEDIVCFNTKDNSINLEVTKNHSMVIERYKQKNYKHYMSGVLTKVRAEDVCFHRDNYHHTTAPTSNSLGYKQLTPEQRLWIAFQADGQDYIAKDVNKHWKVKFRFTKERKIQRLKDILQDCGLEYTTSVDSGGVTNFAIVTPTLPKTLEEWVDLSCVTKDWALAFLDELSHWDASKAEGNRGFFYMSTVKSNVDVAHAVACLAGVRSKYIETERPAPRSTLWKLYVRGSYKPLNGEHIVKSYKAYRGTVYCAEVPSGMLLVRYKGVTSVCGNTRRAAYAAYQDISHPEIEEFLQIRKPTGGDPNRKCLNLHHGVNLTDAFMEAVAKGLPWNLIDPNSKTIVRTIDARMLWGKILEMRLETGEPYIHFIDHSNAKAAECHKALNLLIHQSNLCVEVVQPTSEERTAVCCLSSVNLEYYDQWSKTTMVQDLIRFLDNVLQYFIDNAPETMAKAKYSAMRERSLGLGAMGFHSMLQAKGIPFESAMAESWNRKIFSYIRSEAEIATEELGRAWGSAPDYAEYNCLIHQGLLEKPRRNVYLMAIAPNASSSILANTSPSIEPIVANVFTHKTSSGSFQVVNKELLKLLKSKLGEMDEPGEQILKLLLKSITEHEGSVQHLEILSDHEKEVFKTAFELDQRWIIDHASVRQQWIDQAQSVNLFLRAGESKANLHALHYRAWKKGLKTLYYCRSLAEARADKLNKTLDRVNLLDYSNASANNDECLSCQG